MAITTPDAIPGEIIEAAWGDAVRADLTAHDTAIVARVRKTGDTMTGPLQVGGDPGNGEIGSNLFQTGSLTLRRAPGAGNTLSLNRGTTAGGSVGDSYVRMYNANGGTDTQAGNITLAAGPTVVYGTSSDARLKSVTRPVDPEEAVAKVAAMEPVNYLWLTDPSAGEQTGFLAQDLVTIAPEAIAVGHGDPGDDDFVPWSIDPGKLVPTLVAAIQALTARITALEEAAP